MAYAMLAEEAQHQAHVDLAHDDAASAHQQAKHAEVGPGHMEQGHADEDRVPRLDQRPGGAGAAEAGGVVGLGQLDALGQSGGAGGIELDDVVVRLGCAPGIRGGMSADPVPETRPGRVARLELDSGGDVRKIRGQGLDHPGIIRANHHQATAGVLQDEGDLGRRQAPVDRGQAGARLQAAEPEHEEIRVAPREGSDPIPRLDAGGDQGVGAL